MLFRNPLNIQLDEAIDNIRIGSNPFESHHFYTLDISVFIRYVRVRQRNKSMNRRNFLYTLTLGAVASTFISIKSDDDRFAEQLRLNLPIRGKTFRLDGHHIIPKGVDIEHCYFYIGKNCKFVREPNFKGIMTGNISNCTFHYV